ncbi:MAG: FAD-dependent oxidoreductase [Clostridia bacterium]|nr:FAD-dependent oxidoreductase [Clostridia bacterium]
MKQKIAIIGGGYTGLCCAKKLLENNFEVTIYEKTDKIRWNGKVHKL